MDLLMSTLIWNEKDQFFCFYSVTVICEPIGKINVFFVRPTVNENTTKPDLVQNIYIFIMVIMGTVVVTRERN
jgi:hypothetical protein